MTATRNILRGELIFSEKPLNRGPKMSGKPVCLGCYRVLRGGDVLCPMGMNYEFYGLAWPGEITQPLSKKLNIVKLEGQS